MNKKGFYYELVNKQIITSVGMNSKFSEYLSPINSEKAHKEDDLSIHIQDSVINSTIDIKTEIVDTRKVAFKKDIMNDYLKKDEEVSLSQILKMARPEWKFFIFGIILCLIQGSIYPIASIFFSQIIEVKKDLQNK